MKNSIEHAVLALNRLIEICKDGENGYRSAASGVKDPTISQHFEDYAQQRAQFAAELEAEILGMGGEPEISGSVASAFFRGWANMDAAVNGRDEEAILTECERGEDIALSTYEEALQSSLPRETLEILMRQISRIAEAHSDLRTLQVQQQRLG